VEIGNHTDFRGDDDKNLILSLKRAESLKQVLILKGIRGDRLSAKGYGETHPIRSKTEQDKLGDHAKNVNRRTTLKILN
jgi:outer membrane protein OmpA-like peptidoglycan-associated protein